jgi:hypothetical protein
MIRFFRQIRRQFISQSKFGKYFLYAIGEIVLVVIGILIALQINNWNNRQILDRSEIKSYQNIKQQLLEDKTELNEVKAFNNYQSKIFEYANNIIEQKDYSLQDSLAPCLMSLAWFSDFHRSGKIYETLVNNGDIKLMNNDSIPIKLQKLEMTYIFANKLEDTHWEMINYSVSKELRGIINYATRKPVKPEKLYTVEMQNQLVTSMYLMTEKDKVYAKGLKEIDGLIKLLNSELEQN